MFCRHLVVEHIAFTRFHVAEISSPTTTCDRVGREFVLTLDDVTIAQLTIEVFQSLVHRQIHQWRVTDVVPLRMQLDGTLAFMDKRTTFDCHRLKHLTLDVVHAVTPQRIHHGTRLAAVPHTLVVGVVGLLLQIPQLVTIRPRTTFHQLVHVTSLRTCHIERYPCPSWDEFQFTHNVRIGCHHDRLLIRCHDAVRYVSDSTFWCQSVGDA